MCLLVEFYGILFLIFILDPIVVSGILCYLFDRFLPCSHCRMSFASFNLFLTVDYFVKEYLYFYSRNIIAFIY